MYSTNQLTLILLVYDVDAAAIQPSVLLEPRHGFERDSAVAKLWADLRLWTLEALNATVARISLSIVGWWTSEYDCHQVSWWHWVLMALGIYPLDVVDVDEKGIYIEHSHSFQFKDRENITVDHLQMQEYSFFFLAQTLLQPAGETDQR